MFSKKFILVQLLFISLFSTIIFIQKPFSVSSLPIFGKINDFELTSSEDSKVTLSTFKNKIWVADFIFTTCGGICPKMTKNLAVISDANRLKNDILFASISVNPETDTPEMLKSYAKKNHADSAKWLFLTGTREEITRMAVDSFKLGSIDEPVFHSAYFTLIDRQSRIRGYYDGTDLKGVDKLLKDIKRLRKEK